MNLRKVLFSLFLMLPYAGISQTKAVKSWDAEFQTGIVYNAKLPLDVKQSGYSDIIISKAEYSSYPLTLPIYFSLRVNRWVNDESISFEFIHHKIYLENCPPEIQSFSVSHGFNMMMLNYGRKINRLVMRTGAGTVLAHTESVVRGKEYPYETGLDPGGYRVNGFSIQLSVARPLTISRTFFINTEFKTTAAFTNVPVVDGHAKINLLTFHLIAGPGFSFVKRKSE